MMGQSLIVLFCICLIHAAPQAADGHFELIILHNNDMHARFEQTNSNGNKCTKADADVNKCFGGFARVAHEIREFRNQADAGGVPVLYLNAGDTYTGTPWFQLFKENITAAFLNKLKPDAISLGNHEFDEGTEVLGKFLGEINFPVLCANIDIEKEQELKNEHLKSSHIFEIQGNKIGVIGYLTPETKMAALTIEVEFSEEINSINIEAQNLKNQGVNILIALGHSGIEKDQQIAANCPDIDLVIGGHSHTFLYTGKSPSNDVAHGNYPIVVKQGNGKEVPVVQAKSLTKYLGKLHVIFDNSGNLITFEGTPILLNGSIPRDEDLLELLNDYRPAVEALEKRIVGETKVKLDGDCRLRECNLGNLIADAFVDSYLKLNTTFKETNEERSPLIGMMNGGGIRASIDSPGNITMESFLAVLPFESKIEVVEISGKELYEVLERSVYRYDNGIANGEFAQFSGLQVRYDINRPRGKRVVAVKVVCAHCPVPELVDIDLEMKYRIILQNFLADGGDGYKMLEGKSIYKSELLDTFVLLEYLKKKSPVAPAVEWRLTVDDLLDRTEVVGETKVKLDHSECGHSECNIGNFIADAMVDFYALHHNSTENWTDAPIALVNSKNLRATYQKGSSLTRENILHLLGSIEYIHVKELTGAEMKKLIEFALAHDQLLQVSGLEMKIDMNKADGDRVTSLMALCTGCQSPQMEIVRNEKKYKVLMQASMAEGKDGFDTVYGNSDSVEIEKTDLELVIDYIKKQSPIYTVIERRIEFTDKYPNQPIIPPEVDSPTTEAQINGRTTI